MKCKYIVSILEIKLAKQIRGFIMTALSLIKRSSFLFILLFATQVYSQETIIPLTKGGWVGGLSGNVSWDNYKINNSQIDGFNFSVSSRNGRFVLNDLSVGFDFQWSEKEKTSDNFYTEFNRLGFAGLWIRYYIPFFGTGLAMYPEVSAGYGNFKFSVEKNYTGGVEPAVVNNNSISADGFAYNIGLGITKFISNTIAFEITGRYQGGSLSGNYEYYDKSQEHKIELSNIDILFGIMIYLK